MTSGNLIDARSQIYAAEKAATSRAGRLLLLMARCGALDDDIDAAVRYYRVRLAGRTLRSVVAA